MTRSPIALLLAILDWFQFGMRVGGGFVFLAAGVLGIVLARMVLPAETWAAARREFARKLMGTELPEESD